MIELSSASDRRKLADIVTASVKQLSQMVEKEHRELAARRPSLARKATKARVAPDAMRKLLQSEEYTKIVESYVDGRLEGDLLSHVMDFLQKVAPVEPPKQ